MSGARIPTTTGWIAMTMNSRATPAPIESLTDLRLPTDFFHEALAVGEAVEVSEEVYRYHMSVLPPVIPFPWDGKVYDFGHAEGLEHFIAFRALGGGKFEAVRTDVTHRPSDDD